MIVLALEVLAAALASVTFSALYNTPKSEYPYCGGVGAAVWLCYRVLGYWAGALLPVLAALVLAGVLSRRLAVVRRAPSNIFLIASFFPIVPGKGIYDTIYLLMSDDVQRAVTSGVDALKVVGVIVLGIIIAYSLPDALFSGRKDKEGQGEQG